MRLGRSLTQPVGNSLVGPSDRATRRKIVKRRSTKLGKAKIPPPSTMSEKAGGLSPSAANLDSDVKKSNIPPIGASIVCDIEEDDYPEGGRGWIVVAGCFLQATVTLGEFIRIDGHFLSSPSPR